MNQHTASVLVNSPRVVLGVAAATSLFVAGWWTGRAFRPAPARAPDSATAAAPHNTPAATAASPTAGEALARFAADNHALPRRELTALLRTASAAEIPALLERVSQLPHRLDRERFRAALLARWVALDTAAARAWAEARPVLEDRREALRDVFSAWSQQAPAAVAALITSNDIPGGIETLDDVLSAWLASDPARAKGWVANITNSRLRSLAIQSLVSVLAQDDPAAAFDAALAASTEQGGRYSLHAAVRAMVLRDPSATATILDRLPAGETRNEAAVQVVEALAASDPKLAAEFALTLPSGYARAQAVAAAIEAMATDPDAAFKWVESATLTEPDRIRALSTIIRQIAETSPQEAIQHLDGFSAKDRSLLCADLVADWARTDVAGATAWTRRRPPGPERDQVAKSLLTIQFQDDPAGALASLQHDFSSLQSDQFYAHLASNSLYASANELLALVPLLPSDSARAQFLTSTLDRLSRSSPEAAAELLDAIPPAQRTTESINKVASTWASVAPVAAATWVAALSDPALRQSACSAVLRSWADTDPDAALRWAATLPDAKTRDAAAQLVVDNWADNDPVAASQWASRISDLAMRRSALEIVARDWLWFDQPAAEQWLATADIPPDRKAALLQEARK